jgi:hypothetical protein
MIRPELSRRVGWNPAFAAGPPRDIYDQNSAHAHLLSDLFLGQSGVIIFPLRINSGTIRLTVSTGMANPIPAEAPDGL